MLTTPSSLLYSGLRPHFGHIPYSIFQKINAPKIRAGFCAKSEARGEGLNPVYLNPDNHFPQSSTPLRFRTRVDRISHPFSRQLHVCMAPPFAPLSDQLLALNFFAVWADAAELNGVLLSGRAAVGGVEQREDGVHFLFQ